MLASTLTARARRRAGGTLPLAGSRMFHGDIAMQDAYQKGREAFQEGLKAEQNPHPERTESRKQWEEGWEEAMMEADLKRPSICTGERPQPPK